MINSQKCLFVGAFEKRGDLNNRATSSAGNQVQCEIIEALKNLTSNSALLVQSYALKPVAAWPRGPLWVRAENDDSFKSPSILNVAIFKRFLFSIKLFSFLWKNNPKIVFTYNPGAFDSIALLTYRWMRHVFLVSIIQDVHTGVGAPFGVRWISDGVALKLARWFDLIIPISRCIAEDFNFKPSKVLVFNGGLTRQSRDLLNVNPSNRLPYAVFAGALEKYNGVEQLISIWPTLKANFVLHIFGKGACEEMVKNAEKMCKNIVYHGFSSEEDVAKWQASATLNFCLRYSLNINARYFFPSKFFNVLAAPGAVVVNRFDGFPLELEKFCFIVDDDLKNLQEKIDSIDLHMNNNLKCRRDWLRANAEWRIPLRKALKFSSDKGVGL